MAASERPLPSQAYAREQRRRDVGRPGCDDCGVVPARVVGMIGTAAARERLCGECRMLRRIHGDDTIGRFEERRRIDAARIEKAANAVRQFGEAYRKFEEQEERREHYFWKALPYIWNDERLKVATIRREKEVR